MIRLAVHASLVTPEAWVDDGFGGRELRKAYVRPHTARNPGGHGTHQVSAYERHLASLPPIANEAAPYGGHANWLAAHDKLMSASAQRLAEGKYAQARGLYDLASNVRWSHDQAFGINERIAQHGDAGPMSNEAHHAHYSMWHPKDSHPIQQVHKVMEGMNKQKRADKVHALFSTRDREYQRASESGDRKAVEGWWKKKIAEFESNPELTEYMGRVLEKWRGGYKVAPTDPHRCDRCGGRGQIDSFKHVEGGTCFECGGTGRKDPADLHVVMAKAEQLRPIPVEELRKAEPVPLGEAVGAWRPGSVSFDVGDYLFEFRKAGRGLPILTVRGKGLPMPYHMVVRGLDDARRRAPGVAQAFADGKVPDEGVFRREDDDAVRVRYPGRTQATA